MMNMIYGDGFRSIIDQCERKVLKEAAPVATETWQGGETHVPTYESRYVCFSVDLMGNFDLDYWRSEIKPNLPWADDHFDERVSGEPVNPGTTWRTWPWATASDKHRTEGKKFNHNYMERYWPKEANRPSNEDPTLHWVPRRGIRFEVGDLYDLIGHLINYPLTRAAVFPVYTHEDVAIEARRKPCSIDYHFMMRNGRCDIRYTLRSCDLIRHFRDDIYLTLRLLFWVIQECAKHEHTSIWNEVVPGNFVMMIDSLHAFDHDVRPHRK